MKKSKFTFEESLILWLPPAALVIFVFITIFNGYMVKHFQPFLNQYIQQYGLLGDEAVSAEKLPQPAQAIIVSPILSTDQQTEGYLLSKLTNRLPGSIRAKNPANVNIIILVRETDAVVGSYSGGQPAYIKKMDVTVIDARNNAVILKNTFTGGNPPTSKAGSGPGYGSSPKGSVMRWIKTVLATD